MHLFTKTALIAITIISTNVYALNQKEAAEMFPVTITAIDAPIDNPGGQIMEIHYEISNQGEKGVEAIKALIIFENSDGTVFARLTADSMAIDPNSKNKGAFVYGFDKTRFKDKKMQSLGTKMKTWLRVDEIIYSDGTHEIVTK